MQLVIWQSVFSVWVMQLVIFGRVYSVFGWCTSAIISQAQSVFGWYNSAAAAYLNEKWLRFPTNGLNMHVVGLWKCIIITKVMKHFTLLHHTSAVTKRVNKGFTPPPPHPSPHPLPPSPPTKHTHTHTHTHTNKQTNKIRLKETAVSQDGTTPSFFGWHTSAVGESIEALLFHLPTPAPTLFLPALLQNTHSQKQNQAKTSKRNCSITRRNNTILFWLAVPLLLSPSACQRCPAFGCWACSGPPCGCLWCPGEWSGHLPPSAAPESPHTAPGMAERQLLSSSVARLSSSVVQSHLLSNHHHLSSFVCQKTMAVTVICSFCHL